MDNSKRNVHRSGPLGMLMNSGQLEEVNAEISRKQELTNNIISGKKPNFLLKESGIHFSENELLYVDPKECEPWEFANRHQDEMGDIKGLMDSISKDNQLQPALIRPHPAPHGSIKFQVIFGRRRHYACLKLSIPFLVIKKDNMDFLEALSSQHSENKCRNDVSPYSDALMYAKILDAGVIKEKKELAKSLNMSKQSLSDLLSFTKIPQELLEAIPNPHILSVNMAKTLLSLIKRSPLNFNILLKNAHLIGVSVNSTVALEKLCNKTPNKTKLNSSSKPASQLYKSDSGKPLFSLTEDKKGLPTIVLDKDILSDVNPDEICQVLRKYILELNKIS